MNQEPEHLTFIQRLRHQMKEYPTSTLFLAYISVMVTLLFIIQIARLGHA